MSLSLTINAGTLTKVWSYGYTSNSYDWEVQYVDEWGGINSQCTKSNGSQCGKWDWSAVYVTTVSDPGSGTPDPDPCPQNNNPLYGHGLVVDACTSQGESAPPYLPTFSIQ